MRNSIFLTVFLFLFLHFFLGVHSSFAQDDKPSGQLSTPQEVIYQHLYYLQDVHYNIDSSAQVMAGRNKKVTEEDRILAIKLKQILDGKAIYVRPDLIPNDPDYIDSLSGNPVYVFFPKELPQIYVVRPVVGKDSKNRKYADYWTFPKDCKNNILELHKKVYPFGSHLLLDMLPQGGSKFLGLKSWQYIAILVLFVLVFLLHFITWRLLNFIFELLAQTRLGQDHFDPAIIVKISRLMSFMVVIYIFNILFPILLLPVWISYYLVAAARVFNTVFSVLILLNAVELARSYFETVVAKTESKSDDQLLPVFIKVIKTFVIIGGTIHILDIFEVDLTALIAGLSIGGLALALAAQDTVKNLIGSIMIYADRPFQIGDFISSGDIMGTVEEIGFRSTRIRTTDSSLISIPNGTLMDMTVNNMGSMTFRRFNTTIGVAYYTPPAMIEKFVEGLRLLNKAHPITMDDRYFIHLNNMGGSSLDIMFMVYFKTTEYAKDLEAKEQLILSILRLAEAMNVHIAFPSTSVYIESMPEKKGQMPDYSDQEMEAATVAMNEYLDQITAKYANENESDGV